MAEMFNQCLCMTIVSEYVLACGCRYKQPLWLAGELVLCVLLCPEVICCAAPGRAVLCCVVLFHCLLCPQALR